MERAEGGLGPVCRDPADATMGNSDKNTGILDNLRIQFLGLL